MAKVELKQPIVAEISELLNGAKSAVVVDYRGLTVEQDTQLRKQLREAGVTYKVYKNTMIRFAAKGTEFEALEPNLEGPTALAVSKEDATAPARVLAEFAKKADKAHTTMRRESRLSLLSRPEKFFSESYWEASSPRSQTLHALSIRSQRAKRHNRNYYYESRMTAMIQLLLEVNKNGKINYCRIY